MLSEYNQVGERNRNRYIKQGRVHACVCVVVRFILDGKGVDHQDEYRNDGKRNIFYVKAPSCVEEYQQEEYYAGNYGHDLGKRVALPYRDSAKFKYHRTHYEYHKGCERPLAAKQTGDHDDNEESS